MLLRYFSSGEKCRLQKLDIKKRFIMLIACLGRTQSTTKSASLMISAEMNLVFKRLADEAYSYLEMTARAW